MINRFRREVSQSFEQRGGAGLDLIDALSSAGQVESPVSQSESVLFRRKYSSVYDVLKQGRLALPQVRRTLFRHQPGEAEQIAGYAVYATDCTDEPHPAAETLPDRTQSKKGREAAKVVGHRYSWLVRVVGQRPSWCLAQDVERVASASTDSVVAAEQVKRLDQQYRRRKAVVADSLYCNYLFLAAFLVVSTVVALVRMRSNRVLYEALPERADHQWGRPRQHGRKFKPSEPHRPPDRLEGVTLLGQDIRLQAWHNLHFYKLPALVGWVLRIEFLKADGTPRFKRPLYLFWTGPQSVALADLCRMYLWRFAMHNA